MEPGAIVLAVLIIALVGAAVANTMKARKGGNDAE